MFFILKVKKISYLQWIENRVWHIINDQQCCYCYSYSLQRVILPSILDKISDNHAMAQHWLLSSSWSFSELSVLDLFHSQGTTVK